MREGWHLGLMAGSRVTHDLTEHNKMEGDAELDRFLASNPAAKHAFDRRMREAEAKAEATAQAKVNVLLLRQQQEEAQFTSVFTKMADDMERARAKIRQQDANMLALRCGRRMPASCSFEARLAREFA
jgi:hypothetical protein